MPEYHVTKLETQQQKKNSSHCVPRQKTSLNDGWGNRMVYLVELGGYLHQLTSLGHCVEMLNICAICLLNAILLSIFYF